MGSLKKKAMKLWIQNYGDRMYAEDFHGNLMYRDAYGDPEFYIKENGDRIYCGWNLHHILPAALGGTSDYSNLLCTNILTNEAAGDRVTFWIDDILYQVHRIKGTNNHVIRPRN